MHDCRGQARRVDPTADRSYAGELWRMPKELLSLPEADRKLLSKEYVIESPPGGFAENALTQQAPISLAEEVLVVGTLLIVMGGPLLLLPTLLLCLVFGSWTSVVAWVLVVALLAMHPLPECSKAARESIFATALYKYFTYRFVWSGDAREKGEAAPAWIGAGPPHGVLPFANVLSIPAINTFACRHFVGAGASVVEKTPFLRYMSLFGMIDVSARSITKALARGTCVGLVPDGIAGIFRTNARDEVVKLKERKGIAKLALRTGTPIVPAYSVGNSRAYTAVFDRWGLLEIVSRKAQASIFLYFGRFYLPIPRRVNITMLIGEPIMVDKVEEPTPAQIDALHERYLTEMKALFDQHKASLGWGHLNLIYE